MPKLCFLFTIEDMKKGNQSKNKSTSFDINGIGQPNGNIFGLPFSYEESEVIILPVPWEVTASFGSGTANGPEAIMEASIQLDFYDADFPEKWKKGIFMKPVSLEIKKLNSKLKKQADVCINYLEKNDNFSDNSKIKKNFEEINQKSEELNKKIEKESLKIIKDKKIAAVLGGDHSAPLGLLSALSKTYDSFGILHIDAHLDLRKAYEGFAYSHASVMRNASLFPEIKKFIHLGVRDFCEEEINFTKKNSTRHLVFSDRYLKEEKFKGVDWHKISWKIIKNLPSNVYVSFDIDGLDPKLCPHTGTPVPGGLEFEEAFYLIKQIKKSGRKIIGFDLSEVAPASKNKKTWQADWNANVGMRTLYRLFLATSLK